MKIIDLTLEHEDLIRQAAYLYIECFPYTEWPDLETVIEEVKVSLQEGKICRAAVDDDGTLLGWIGGISHYGGNVWEMHPLMVKVDMQRKGIGTALVRDFEKQVAERGGLTIWLGTDDATQATSLSGVDLYDNLWERIRDIKNLNNHPFEFYKKLGYEIVGVMPDANGIGKPDIYMAKRVKDVR